MRERSREESSEESSERESRERGWTKAETNEARIRERVMVRKTGRRIAMMGDAETRGKGRGGKEEKGSRERMNQEGCEGRESSGMKQDGGRVGKGRREEGECGQAGFGRFGDEGDSEVMLEECWCAEGASRVERLRGVLYEYSKKVNWSVRKELFVWCS